MAKFKNVGYFAKKRKDPTKRSIVITESIIVPPSSDPKKPNRVFIELFEPRQGDNQTDEAFAKLTEWKLKDLVIISDE